MLFSSLWLLLDIIIRSKGLKSIVHRKCMVTVQGLPFPFLANMVPTYIKVKVNEFLQK